MRVSEWRRRGAGGGVQVFDGQVATGPDDGAIVQPATYNNTDTVQNRPGDWIGADMDVWARFDGVTIPAGATIQTAYVSVRFEANAGIPQTRLYFEAADDPLAPTTIGDFNGRTPTTAFTDWDAAPSGGWSDSDSIVNVLQEVIDRPGWNSGQALLILWMEQASPGSEYYKQRQYEFAGNDQGMKLHVEYTT